MPHIKNIRIVNVHFNNATQFYEDFRMKPGGKNTTYDLENGGGKSLLLLMILQTVLPKTNLRREKPISLIFQGGKERTSHVAVEWILEEGSDYKYLLTGFAARKRRGANETLAEAGDDEEQLQAGDIEHLNWCIFYNDNKTTGIKAAPFVVDQSGRKTYASFEDIRKYIQQMRQKGLPAEVFDKIEQYQRHIAAHGLIPAEWNIIRGINSGENNIESYFRQDATSRKLIENQFVKIVEDMEALNRGEKYNNESALLADTLIEIRGKLNEYLKHKGHMAEYEKIKEYYGEFAHRNTELFKVFSNFESYKQKAASIRNLIGSKLAECKQKEQDAGVSLAANTDSRNQGKSLKTLLEAGLINHEKEGLIEVSSKLEADRQRLTDRQTELEGHLNHLLTLEGYGSYRTDLMQIKELESRLKILTATGNSLRDDHQAAGGRLKHLVNLQFNKIEAEHQKTVTAKNELKEKSKTDRMELVTAERQEAVLASNIRTLTQSENDLAAKQKSISDFFLARGETEALLSSGEFLEQTEKELSVYQEESAALAAKLTELDSKSQSLALEAVTQASEIKRLSEKKDQHASWLKAYQNELALQEQKAAAFGKTTVQDYHAALIQNIESESLSRLEKEIEAGRLRQKKQLSTARGYYVPNEEILNLAEKLNSKCEFVQAGIDWLAKSDNQEKEQTLKAMPYLPFSVIVDRVAFEKLKGGKLKHDFSSDYPVPIVNVETLRTWAEEQAEVYYILSFTDLVLDVNSYQAYLDGMEEAILAGDREIAAIGTRIDEFGQTLSALTNFFAQYPLAKVEDTNDAIGKLNKEISALAKQQQTLKAAVAQGEQQKQTLLTRTEEVSNLILDSRNKRDKLTDIIQLGRDLADIRQQFKTTRDEHKTVLSNITAINNKLTDLDGLYEVLEEKISGLLVELNQITKDKERVAAFGEIESSRPLSEVQSEFSALDAALSGKLSEENELIRQKSESATRLDELKARILRDHGKDLDEIAKSEESGAYISIPTSAMIQTARQAKNENNKQLAKVNEELQKAALAIKAVEVRLDELLKTFTPTEIPELPVYDNKARYKQEIEEVIELIKIYDQAIFKANEELETIRRITDKLTDQAEYYDAFIERESIINTGSTGSETKEFRAFEKEYYQLWDLVKSQCEKWESRLRTVSEETAAFVIREPLEVLAMIGSPETAEICNAREQHFSEYIANLEEQMQKINNDILQLESYQQDFTRRCVQRAELMLGQLRKLEALSRIEVYGRRINMIELRLQEFEEKEKYLRMKAHINGIVQEISEEGTFDRKRIVTRLSIKELLAQIADMEKAVVRLYKIESIPENSKFYRWENAIGSEGQNNSLYFIFAACLISFIRMLSIANSSVKTKKVIIADNPFGATSAVYLWDPMFKIMKQNDVQLIAPGHRIPREITSRFGVSYLLNQDILEDGRMRVVVKDVRAEEDEDMLRYVETEQLSMMF